MLEADKLLSAIGFAPRTEGYGLEAAGVELTERGAVAIDEYCRTNVPNVYAIGDCTAKLMLAHVAEAQGIVAAETLAGAETMPVDYDFIPRATYCHPQIGSFGYSEAQAKEKGYDVKTATFPFTANGKAMGLGDAVGLRQGRRRRQAQRDPRRPPDRPRRHRAAAGARRWRRSGTSPPTRWRATCSRTRRSSEAVKEAVEGIVGHMINF